MAIVRELLIRLGFQTDKKAINATNQAITGFKTRFAIAATAATYAFKIVKDFFDQVASATLDADELARALGLSFNELTALQQAAQQFRIKPEQFSGVLSMLQKDLNEFLQGFGRLPELARQFGLQFSRETTSLELFDLIVGKIREIENEQERIRISSLVFGDQLGAKISDLSQNFDVFRESVKSAYDQIKDIPDMTPEFRAYEQAVNQISISFSNLFRTIITQVSPALKFIADGLSVFVKLLGGYASLITTGSRDSLDSATKEREGFFGNIGNWVAGRFQEAGNALIGLDPRNSNAPSINVTNSIDVNVPEGTTQEQVAFLSQEMQELINASIMDTFYQIQNNNPVVE